MRNEHLLGTFEVEDTGRSIRTFGGGGRQNIRWAGQRDRGQNPPTPIFGLSSVFDYFICFPIGSASVGTAGAGGRENELPVSYSAPSQYNLVQESARF